MKLGDFFIQLSTKGDTKELDKTIKQLEEANQKSSRLVKYINDLKKATTQEEKTLIKKNFAEKVGLENLKKQKSALIANKNALLGVVKGFGALVAGATIAYKVIDRMVDSLSIANQKMINFQRQTGISFASLNKYASASASVNYNASPEQMANTMQSLAQNLYDIRMGRGDISPYQELAFVGGKAFNPFGMSVEELIESVRTAIRGVNDVQATNLITRMGFSPEDLLMLRMTREEFEKINDLFMSPQEREQMNAYSLQIKKMRLEFQLTGQRLILAIMPAFVKLSNIVTNFSAVWGKALSDFITFVNKSPAILGAIKGLAVVFAGVMAVIHPLIAGLTALYLILEDLAYWNAGKGSAFGDLFGNKGTDKYSNSAMGKATNGIGKGWEYINLAKNVIFAKGEEREIARAKLNDFVQGLSNNSVVQGATPYMTPANSNFNQTNNVNINTSSNGADVTSAFINQNSGIYKQLTPQGI